MYLRTDEERQAVEGLSSVYGFSRDLELESANWRWVVIALHSTVQGFMVLALRHGNGLLALSPKSHREWMEAYESGGTYPPEKLDTYLGLYSKIKSPTTGQIGGNRRFVPERDQGRSIKRLDSIRNEFIHFTPKGWSLELDGLPSICLDCLQLVRFLGWDTDNIFWHGQEFKAHAIESYERLVVRFNELKEHYGSGS